MRSQMEAVLQVFETEDIEALSGDELGASLEDERKAIDRLEADCSRRLARFVALRGFEASGALDPVAWLKQHGRLSGGAAAERVRVASKLADLPVMATAFANGQISFGQAAVVARAAGDVGPEAVPVLERRTGGGAPQRDPRWVPPCGQRTHRA